MKSLILSFLFCGVLLAHAQNDRYTAAMKANLALFDSAKTTQDFQAVANTFERIGDAEKTQWLPYYYAGLALTTNGWIDQKLDKDANSAKVNTLCDKAEVIEKNAEIYAIRNMSATQQMMVDPQSRYMTYGAQAAAFLKKGKEIDPNNPRLFYLEGMSIFNTPPAFGGGKEKAKPIFEKTVALYKTFQVKPLYPDWGKQQADDMLAKCQ